MRLVTLLILSIGMLFSKGVWDGQTRFTIIENNQGQIRVRSFDPSSLQGTEMIIPGDLDIQSLGGRGSWSAKNIFKAGPSAWAAGSIIDYLGLGYVGAWDNLSVWNKLAWMLYQNKVSWATVELSRGGLTSVVTMPDGQSVRRLNSVWFGQAKQLFASKAVTDKHLSLSIVNTTDAAGLGSHAADVAESLGFKVDAVTDSPDKIAKCRLEALPVLVKDVVIKLLARTFACDVVAGPDEELKMWLGQNYKTTLR